MRIAFFGSSLVSAYWNGAATYYRGIIRALAARGYQITFYEPDAFDRQRHRDMADPPWAKVGRLSGDRGWGFPGAGIGAPGRYRRQGERRRRFRQPARKPRSWH